MAAKCTAVSLAHANHLPLCKTLLVTSNIERSDYILTVM